MYEGLSVSSVFCSNSLTLHQITLLITKAFLPFRIEEKSPVLAFFKIVLTCLFFFVLSFEWNLCTSQVLWKSLLEFCLEIYWLCRLRRIAMFTVLTFPLINDGISLNLFRFYVFQSCFIILSRRVLYLF